MWVIIHEELNKKKRPSITRVFSLMMWVAVGALPFDLPFWFNLSPTLKFKRFDE
jgi:hypothetical protein